jgi:hypothetical protein
MARGNCVCDATHAAAIIVGCKKGAGGAHGRLRLSAIAVALIRRGADLNSGILPDGSHFSF